MGQALRDDFFLSIMGWNQQNKVLQLLGEIKFDMVLHVYILEDSKIYPREIFECVSKLSLKL